MSKFYGEKEIKDVKDHLEHATYQVLVFKDGTEFAITKKMMAETITDKPIDATQLRERRCFPVVGAMLGVLLDWDIHISEIEYVDQRVIMSVNESLKKANEVLWGCGDRQNTMLRVHDVLKKAPQAIQSPYVPKK